MSFKGAVQAWRRMLARNVYALNKFYKGGTGAAHEVTLTATQLNKANRQVATARIGAVTTGDMTEKFSVFTAENTATLSKAFFIPDDAFSTTAEAFAYELINAGAAGSGTASIGSIDLSGEVADLVAHKPADFGTLTNAQVASKGGVLLQVVKKGSSGGDSKAGVVVLEFTI